MRHSATACDVYQMTEKAYLYRWELSNGVNWNSSVGMKKNALRDPSSGRCSDHTEHKGNERKGYRSKTLDATLGQAMDPKSSEWVSSQREQEAK
jgi:hypothetical protein